MNFLIAILVVYGITNIVTQGSIFYSFREWFSKKIQENVKLIKIYSFIYKMISCPMCFGFWVGCIVGMVLGPFPFWNIVFNGALYSGTTWLIFCLSQFLGQGYDPSRTLNIIFQNELNEKIINSDKESSNKKVQ